MNEGFYKENPDAFFEDWEASNGNSYAREIFAGSLGFKSEYIDEYTLTDTIVQNYKNGDMWGVYHAWAALPDEQQKIGFIYDDLNGLAKHRGVQFQDLDDNLKKFTNATIDQVEKEGVIDKSAGPSAANMGDYMRAELLKRYANDQNGTTTERYERARESIKKELGYVNGTLVNFDSDGYRGSGLFRQKQGYQQVRLLEHWDNNKKHGLFEGFDRFGNKTFKDEFKYGLRVKHRTFDKTKTISFDRKKEGS